MSTLATMPRWFRAALVMIAVAGATVGSAYALPRNCSGILKRLDEDTAKANYWAALALSASQDHAWDEYQFYQGQYAFWVQQAGSDLLAANRAHCY
jgi:hypothetical protein